MKPFKLFLKQQRKINKLKDQLSEIKKLNESNSNNRIRLGRKLSYLEDVITHRYSATEWHNIMIQVSESEAEFDRKMNEHAEQIEKSLFTMTGIENFIERPQPICEAPPSYEEPIQSPPMKGTEDEIYF